MISKTNMINAFAYAMTVCAVASSVGTLYCQGGQHDGRAASALPEVKSASSATELLYRACRSNAANPSEYELLGVTVRDYRLVDLDGDATQELVLTLDYHSTGATAPVLVMSAAPSG